MRTDKETSLGAALFKQQWRKKLTQEGKNIVLTIGDQDSDLEGDDTGIKVKIPCYYASSN